MNRLRALIAVLALAVVGCGEGTPAQNRLAANATSSTIVATDSTSSTAPANPTSPARASANFSVSRDETGEFVTWAGNRYRILDPRGAGDETTLRLLRGARDELGVAFGVSDGLAGQKIAIECIFWVSPNPFGANYQRACDLPDGTVFTGFGNLIEFTPAQWEALSAQLERQYPGAVTNLGTSRSVLVLGTVGMREFGFASNRMNYLPVDAWAIIGNTSDYATMFDDALRLVELGGQMSTAAR